MPPPDMPLPRALQAFRSVSDYLLHPLVVRSLGPVLTRPAAEAALKVQPLTLREAAGALAEVAPDLARGTSVARPWQDGRQVRCCACSSTDVMSTSLPQALALAIRNTPRYPHIEAFVPGKCRPGGTKGTGMYLCDFVRM